MPANLPKARDLFLHAVGNLPPEQWDNYVAEACVGDAELQRQVGHLLQVHLEAGSFLERPAAAPAGTAAYTPADGEKRVGEGMIQAQEAPGAVIGPYKLLQQIGEGGMGTVWMAEQTQPVQRKVALKLIKAGMDSRQVIARFEAERQALALMDHPNIARVLDAGTIPFSIDDCRLSIEDKLAPQSKIENRKSKIENAGRPYFVMELVKGVPITKYCDEHHLTPRQRLELFIPVCQAVQHAHQKGIIHRDLKPSNVMVCLYDGKPVPKVIDFGIAKATGARLTEKTLFTEVGQVVGTLEYMSPEQAELNQLDIDTRSDIYSLGVLLYELLTGTTPLERKRFQLVAFLEVLRLIREEESPRPSTRLSSTEGLPSIAANRGLEPKKLSGLMRGELDWIVMKTLEKDRNRRYETANGLAMDVQRYLADEAVQACPPSAWYRARKFARRNKTALTAGTLVLLALVLGTVISTWQAIQAIEARDAEREARSALDAASAEKERQMTRTNRSLSGALVEAAGLRGKARTARPGDVEPLSQLRATLRRADTLAASELADPVLVGQVRAMMAEFEQDEVDRRMVTRLEEIRLHKGNLQESWIRFASSATRRAYEAAFRDYGLPVFDLDIDKAATRIAASRIRDWLVVALDDCAGDDDLLCKRLLPIALRVVNDRWRRQYFDARLRDDRPALVGLAKQPGTLTQPPAILSILAEHVSRIDSRAAVALLTDAQRRFPADLWINNSLAGEVGKLVAPATSRQDAMRYKEQSIGFHRAALAARPQSPALQNVLGFVLMDAGHHEEAIAVLRQSIQLNADNSSGYIQLGCALAVKGDRDAALTVLREGNAHHPKLADFHVAIGELLAGQGRWYAAFIPGLPATSAKTDLDGAISAFRKAIEVDPTSIQASTLLADALRAKGDLDGAIAVCRKASPTFLNPRLNPHGTTQCWPPCSAPRGTWAALSPPTARPPSSIRNRRWHNVNWGRHCTIHRTGQAPWPLTEKP